MTVSTYTVCQCPLVPWLAMYSLGRNFQRLVPQGMQRSQVLSEIVIINIVE